MFPGLWRVRGLAMVFLLSRSEILRAQLMCKLVART